MLYEVPTPHGPLLLCAGHTAGWVERNAATARPRPVTTGTCHLCSSWAIIERGTGGALRDPAPPASRGLTENEPQN